MYETSNVLQKQWHLKQHIKDVHQDAKYNCQVCNINTKKKSNLTRHMLVHANVRLFTCDLCPKQFARKSHLDEHKSTSRLPRKDIDEANSHLCGNSLCMNIYHLTVEPRSINNERKKCHGTAGLKKGEE